VTGARKSGLVDVEVQIHHRTERAVLVSDDGDRENAVWLALALVEIEMKQGDLAEVTMPEWLAKERGFI
jgi:hypothetical protein